MRPCYQLGSVGFSYGQTPGMSGQFGPPHAGVDIDTNQPSVPEAVSVALTELAGEVKEELLALVTGVDRADGTECDRTVWGEGHDATWTAPRHGHGSGSATLGGRRVPVVRPRMRASNGSRELPVPAYEMFSQTEALAWSADVRTAGVAFPDQRR